MRSQVVGGIAIHYPDRVCFAFNPCICKAVNVGGGEPKYTITSCGGQSIRIMAHNGIAVWDIRELMQLAVRDKVTASGTVDWTVGYKIQVYGDEETLLGSVDVSSFVVWGALKQGETYNVGRRMAYFKGWPFDFGVYLDGHSGKLLVKNDRRPDALISIQPYEGIYRFNLPASAEPAKERYEVYDFEGTVSQLTFDNTFDLTFRYALNGTTTKILDIDVMDYEFEHPVYLRWIDRQGFTVYWLFKQGDEKREVSADMEFIRNNLREAGSGSSVGEVYDRRRSYTRVDTLEICSPMVDSVAFDTLQDLTSSPSVDMYDKNTGKWQVVTVKAGTYTKTMEALQDFVCEIMLRETPCQSL